MRVRTPVMQRCAPVRDWLFEAVVEPGKITPALRPDLTGVNAGCRRKTLPVSVVARGRFLLPLLPGRATLETGNTAR